MLTKDYKKSYESLFREFLSNSQSGYFDEAALPSYTHNNILMSRLFWKRVEKALVMAEKLDNCSVLDFGAGGGITFKYLHSRNCTITGCEKEFLSLTKAAAQSLGIAVDLVDDLFKIENRQFDLILALDVFEHLEDPNVYLEKLLELCKPTGQIILSGPTENRLYKFGRRLAGFSGHYHVRNIYDIEQMFRQKGLKQTHLTKLYPVFTLFRISKWSKM